MMSPSRQRATLVEGEGLAVVDGAPVHSVPADLAGEPAILDFRTAIHDHGQARRFGALCCFFVDDAELHPQHLHAEPVLFAMTSSVIRPAASGLRKMSTMSTGAGSSLTEV